LPTKGDGGIRVSVWLDACVKTEPYTTWGDRWKVDPDEKIEKPCHEIGFCPYGQLVEAFPLRSPKERDETACTVFGHDCPVFRCAEPIAE